MAITYIRKQEIFTAVNFDGTIAEASYPAMFKKNAGSPTGYSYGDLSYTAIPENNAFMKRNGFIVPEKCVCVFNAETGRIIEILDQASFNLRYLQVTS